MLPVTQFMSVYVCFSVRTTCVCAMVWVHARGTCIARPSMAHAWPTPCVTLTSSPVTSRSAPCPAVCPPGEPPTGQRSVGIYVVPWTIRIAHCKSTHFLRFSGRNMAIIINKLYLQPQLHNKYTTTTDLNAQAPFILAYAKFYHDIPSN